jgi:hypothetical protein
MAQQGPVPSGEDGSHPATLATDPLRPHDIHPTVDLVEVPAPQPLDYRNPSQPDLEQLPARHHAMLASSEPRNRLVFRASGRFDIHGASK